MRNVFHIIWQAYKVLCARPIRPFPVQVARSACVMAIAAHYMYKFIKRGRQAVHAHRVCVFYYLCYFLRRGPKLRDEDRICIFVVVGALSLALICAVANGDFLIVLCMLFVG